jgi:hypothetical protein
MMALLPNSVGPFLAVSALLALTVVAALLACYFFL